MPQRAAHAEPHPAPARTATPEVLKLAEAIAARYAGTITDVLNLAVPAPRAGGTEPAAAPLPVPAPDTSAWATYTHGEAFLRALTAGKTPRAVWNAGPGEAWPQRFAEAAAATAAAGRGTVIIVPGQTELAALDTALTDLLGPGRHVTLTADMGSTPRYRAWRKAADGAVRIACGTRAAALTPVHDLGLVAIWDDGDTAHIETRAPYPHARDILLTRAHLTDAGVLIGGHTRSTHAQLLVETKWATSITPTSRPRLRVHTTGTDTDLERDGHNTRIPTFAWKAAKDALAAGRAVVVQVARTGYLPLFVCRACGARATCPTCGGTFARDSAQQPVACTRCQRAAGKPACGECGSPRIKASVVGATRTVEELAKAFPRAHVVEATRRNPLATAPPGPSIVVATPGSEPTAAGGYGAVLILDAWTHTTRPEWDAREQAVRRWMNTAALAAPGAPIAVTADAADPAVQALIRWDGPWFAARELAERAAAGLPPYRRFASLNGPEGEPDAFAAALPDDLGADVLGPLPGPDGTEQVFVRVHRKRTVELCAALASIRDQRTLAGAPAVEVRVDPPAIG